MSHANPYIKRPSALDTVFQVGGNKLSIFMSVDRQKPVELSASRLDQLVERVLNLHKTNERTIISIAGVPGSGKTTLAHKVVEQLNKHVNTIAVGQDGFHLYRHQLAQMADPAMALERRGAPFTFDVDRFVDLVKKIRQLPKETIRAPSFDHKLKDPIEDAIAIEPEVEVVILEGNYVSLADLGWDEIEHLVDETWYIETPPRLIRDRIIKRHLEAGIAQTEEEAALRADGSDLQNANYIIKHSKQPVVLIKGI